jgi:enoyl-CoA hydratase
MEMMLTGDSIDGEEAARIGFANRAYPADDLDDAVLAQAEKVARIPADLLQINKRSVHRAMEIMGVRNAIRAMSDYQAMATHLPSVQQHRKGALDAIKSAVDKPPT